MNAKMCSIAALMLITSAPLLAASPEELPKPTYANSVIISLEHSPLDAAEIDYIKANLNFGLYAWLSFSITGIAPDLAWQSDWDDASTGIQSFKNTVDVQIQAAKAKNVRLHLVLISGLARYRWIYHAAKEEDIRNGQWFNDNKLCADANIGNTQDALDDHIWGTLSRYARKLRANLEAKGKATLAFLRQRMTEEPETLIALSGWGESELSYDRINHAQGVQDWICDYSPFAVLEFRDWIQHAGMYDDVSGAFKGQGYAGGGAKYQGQGGLAQFNADFGQGFTSWDLKYYNWSLADDYDIEPNDMFNNDPHRIPFSSYIHGAMMPTTGSSYIDGGFDPPRVMAPGNTYWDLWNMFREAMVHNFLKDLAKWASEAGIPATQWFSHQIPADYLSGTNPSMMPNLNPRYFSSASPLTTSDIAPYGSAGATIYDIKFPAYFARTTLYAVPAIAAMSSNWAVLEYDAETYPAGFSVAQSAPAVILAEYMRTYSYGPHLFNFFRWMDDTGEHRIKGMNKEIALASFITAIRDLGRKADVNTVFSPPVLTGFSGQSVPETGVIRLTVTGKIWSDREWMWKDWGGFSHFEVFRATEPNVPINPAHRIGTTTGYFYDDTTAVFGQAYFYRMRAVNTKAVGGPASDEIMLYPSAGNHAVLSLDKKSLAFGGVKGGAVTPAQNVFVLNFGPSGTNLNWQATKNKTWLSVTPSSGTGEGILSVSVNPAGLAVGTYSGLVTVSDPAALNSPRTVNITLKVYRAGQDDVPFGSFDSPAAGATVMGSIPITGWALDDLGVERVEIRRDPIPGDPLGAIGPDGLIFIGYATFVKGARPDVEASWPGYPNNDRAGWGYMLLTYGLPSQGNGAFRIHAVAFDVGGKKKELGIKNIISDNAHNTKPFGAIDTPTQGGVASGSAFVNFGWALTPLPKEIPRDGSTMTVLIDSVPVGNPIYNQFRQDVRDAYPEYKNSDGAVGYYHIDTTGYANGVHTIGWLVYDDEGAGDGIGSRFFEVQNFMASSQSLTRLIGLNRSGVGDPANRRAGQPGRQEAGMPYVADAVVNKTALAHLPVDDSGKFGIEVAGSPARTIRELGYVIVKLKGRGGNEYVGWGADETRGLPIGSTLDAKAGVFYWMPAPGFLGTHVLNFAVTDGKHRSRPVTVKVTILIR